MKHFVPKYFALCKWLAAILFCQLICVPSSYSSFDSESEFKPFCNERAFYKPYVRISEGRNGKLIKESGPGFLELEDMENIYLCANGFVFLYFKIVQMFGEVYDDAVMQYAAHYCGFFNGKPGPGIQGRNVTLYAVLLIGNSNDYRKISIQMFNAPWFNKTTHTAANFTSLAIINTGGECILQKGKERANIRIKANPAAAPPPTDSSSSKTSDDNANSGSNETEEEPYITVCRLDTNILLQNPDNAPLDTEYTTKEDALLALRLEDEGELSLRGCYEYPLIDSMQLQIAGERLNESKDSHFRIDQNNSERNPQDGSTLKFWTTERLEKYGSPIEEQNNSTLESEMEAKNASYHEEKSKPKDTLDKDKIHEEKVAFELAHFKLKLSPHYQIYKEIFDKAKEYGETCETTWQEVVDGMNDESVQEIRKNHTKSLQIVSEIMSQQRFSPYDRALAEKMEEAINQREEYTKALREKTLEIAPKITKAEITFARLKSYLMQADKRMGKIKKFISEYEKHKDIPKKIDIVDSPLVVSDMLISIKNPSSENASSGDDSIPPVCLNFERKTDQCKAVKPTAERACQIAKNSIAENLETSDWPEEESNKWRDEVFELLAKIFTKACPFLEEDFATIIGRIVRGYLMKKPEGIGVVNNSIPGSPFVEPILRDYLANYKIQNENDTFPALKPKDPEIWEHVIEGLKNCEPYVKPLKFEYAGMRPLKILSNGNEIPMSKEKADMEFAFNWAIDANFKIFATVLGTCYEELGETTAQMFYAGYSADFLDPIRPIWLSNRDNSIFNVILGRYMTSGKGDLWTKYCMEGSFYENGQEKMRPLRKLLVNSYSEPNFFVSGPLEGTRGQYKLSI